MFHTWCSFWLYFAKPMETGIINYREILTHLSKCIWELFKDNPNHIWCQYIHESRRVWGLSIETGISYMYHQITYVYHQVKWSDWLKQKSSICISHYGITHSTLIFLFPRIDDKEELNICIVHHPGPDRELALDKLYSFTDKSPTPEKYHPSCMKGKQAKECESCIYYVALCKCWFSIKVVV